MPFHERPRFGTIIAVRAEVFKKMKISAWLCPPGNGLACGCFGSEMEDQVSNFHFALHASITETWETDLPRRQEIPRVLREITGNARSQLIGGETAIDVVQAAVLAMEDYPLYNAGKGAMLNEPESMRCVCS
jgi:Asparaginase